MKLLTVDLESAIAPVPAATAGEQWMLVRFHRHPLGVLKLGTRAHSAAELETLILRCFERELAQHIVEDNLHAPAERVPVNTLTHRCPRHAPVALPPLTVAVCTRNRAAQIGECLDALCALAYPPDLLDLLVVDNAPSSRDAERLVRERYPRVRYVVEPRPGLDWARNRAILEARGEILAYTDDDVSVDAWWAQALARVFLDHPDTMAVTGLVIADEMDTESQRLFEEYGGFSRGMQRRYYRVDRVAGERAARHHCGAGRFGTGANMAYRRTIFDQIGPFDPALDVGTVTQGGGDLEMFFRILKEGHSLVYEPAALVRHRHRRSYEQLRTQLASNGVGFYAYLVRTARAYPDERLEFIRFGAWWFWYWSVRRLLLSLAGRLRFPRGLIWAELQGVFVGLFRYPRAARVAAELARAFGPQRAISRGSTS